MIAKFVVCLFVCMAHLDDTKRRREDIFAPIGHFLSFVALEATKLASSVREAQFGGLAIRAKLFDAPIDRPERVSTLATCCGAARTGGANTARKVH